MAFIRPQQDFTTPGLGEEYYLGEVVDNNDPKKLNRVKVRIRDLHGTEQDIPDSNLPWAIQMRPNFLGGDTNLSLTSVPRIGSRLVITHVRGDIYQPAYIFELNDASNIVDKGQEDYPDSYALKDSDDNYWHVNLVQDKLDILFNGSKCLQITVDNDTIIGQNNTKTVGGNETNTINGTRETTVEGEESKIVNSSQTNTIANNRTENIGDNLTQTVSGNKTVNSTRLIINTTADVDINAAANVTIDGAEVHLNGTSGGGVVTSTSINHATGVPHGDASGTVKADY